MADQPQALHKELIGTVTSDKMEHTVVVEVTSFKEHPLYHKRYRWTKKYLSDIGTESPKVGDNVRIRSTKPMSKLKRWVVTEVVTRGGETAQRVSRRTTAKPKTAAKK